MLLEIRVKVREMETKEGKKFNTYKAVQKNGTLIDLRFRRDVSPLPKEESIIVVKATDINKDTNRVYPCLWVKEIQEIKAIELEDRIDKEVLEMFVDEDDLPF